jgi:Fe-S oxidoreductase
MEKEYIEREAAIEYARLIYCRDCPTWDSFLFRLYEFDEARSLVKDVPAADVVEERHGEWVKNKSEFYVCSECDTTCPYDVNDDGFWDWTCHYCPNCGADMRGGKNGNE